MAIATLISWLCTASIGAYMLRTWIARGGPRMQRAPGDKLPPVIVYGHVSLATTGLALWISYVLTGLVAVAWAATGLLMPVVGLGVAMVTLWTPYPVLSPGAEAPAAGGMLAAPAEDALAGRLTDEVLARALTDDALARELADEVLAWLPSQPSPATRKSRSYLAPLIPAGHGAAALTTVLLALLTVVNARWRVR
jgi:hypothetical protein